MHKDPERRYATALELAEDLERFLRGERTVARLPGPLARLARTVAQRPVAVALVLAVVLLGTFAFVAWREGRLRRLEASLAEAEWALEKASARYDESQARLPQMRKDYLAHAAAAATEVIEQDSTYARAWFVRSKAYHRQQRYRDALHDLDMAEQRQGHATPEILHFRIDTLQHLDDRESRRRLREDLIQLLAIDEGLLTRCLVAEHLLALAERMPASQRGEILTTAEAVVDVTLASHPRLAITRAHVLELRGDLVGAEQAIRQASVDFASSPLVHARAASMLRRLGHDEEGEEQAYLARILDPDLADAASRAMRPEPVASFDWGEIDGFLGRLMGVLRGSGEPRR
jgi:tetratricopeptide (TPR) repeat protein